MVLVIVGQCQAGARFLLQVRLCGKKNRGLIVRYLFKELKSFSDVVQE